MNAPDDCQKPHHVTHTMPCPRCGGRGYFAFGCDGDGFDCPMCDGDKAIECDEEDCSAGCADTACTCDQTSVTNAP